MDKYQDIKIIASILFEYFKKVALNPEETASIIGRSEDYLKKDREEAIGIPYTRLNGKEKGKPLYNITAIAKALIENEKKVSSGFKATFLKYSNKILAIILIS